MHRELTNLLPSDKSRAFRREYFLRLATVSLLLLTAVIVLHGLLLAPSYLYFNEQIAAKQAQLAQLSASLSQGEEQGVAARLTRIESDTQYLKQLETRPQATQSLAAVLSVPRPGISLTRFAFTASDKPGVSTLTLSGIAASRDSLQRYTGALGALPFVSNANLPISTYAQETELPFLITLTGTMTP